MAGQLSDDDYEALFRSDYPVLVRFVHMLGACLADAEEIAADAYIKLASAAVESPKGWLRTVALRDFAHRARKQQSTQELMKRLEVGEMLTVQPEYQLSITPTILKCIHGLPARQRQVLALTIDGFRPAEIAKELGISGEAARSSLRRARATVRAMLGDEDWD